jgi:hypothetical protein
VGGGPVQLKKLLEKWDLTSLEITAPFLEMEWQPRDEDKDVAWELYVELITQVATQHLDPEEGDEEVGDPTMANELLEVKIEHLEAGRPLPRRRSRR